jgi:hypothetical protein
MLRIPRCLDNRIADGGKVVSITHRPRSTPQKQEKLEYNGTVRHLFIGFKKSYDSGRREVLYNILIEFGVPANWQLPKKGSAPWSLLW